MSLDKLENGAFIATKIASLVGGFFMPEIRDTS